MRKIRKLYYFDKKNTKEMISFLNNKDAYVNNIMFNPFIPLHHILPLRYKFMPETYVLKENKEVKGLITIAPLGVAAKRMEIQKLLFEENCYDDAAELIQYVVSKYKAKGAVSFSVKVDDYLPDLLRTFVSRCNFSQISYEKLWKITDVKETKIPQREFREFRNSDAQMVANLYNESLLAHIRPLFSKESGEYRDKLFKGLSYYSEYKFIHEDRSTGNADAYISIYTMDNKNYIIDVTQSAWAELDYDRIIFFAKNQIQKRQKEFDLYIRTKRYTQNGEKIELICQNSGMECVQNQIVLTNSSARVLKVEEKTGKYTILNNMCTADGIPTTKNAINL